MKEKSPVCAGPLEAPLSVPSLPEPIPFFYSLLLFICVCQHHKPAHCVMCVCAMVWPTCTLKSRNLSHLMHEYERDFKKESVFLTHGHFIENYLLHIAYGLLQILMYSI